MSDVASADVVLIPDTCSLLNVVRAPLLGRSLAGEAAAATSLWTHASNRPGDLVVALSDVAIGEYDAHCASVAAEVRTKLKTLRSEWLHVEAIAGELTVGFTPIDPGHLIDAVVDEVVNLADAIRAGAHKLVSTEDDRLKGLQRTMSRRAPARKGSSAAHDCIITEAAIRVSAERDPFTTWLLTANIRDFGGAGARLDPVLEAEFQGVGLCYATRWGEVSGRLGLGASSP